MQSEEFQHQVERTFGSRLERATPENVRQFAAWFQHECNRPTLAHGRYVLEGDPELSLEGGVKAFLAHTAGDDAETARQRLWVALLEIYFGIIEVAGEEIFAPIFRDLRLPEDDPDG